MRVAFITGHVLGKARKASMIFLAEAAARAGHSVDILSVGHSWVKRCSMRPVNRWSHVAHNISVYPWEPPFHPANLQSNTLNRASIPLFRLYPKLLAREVWQRLSRVDAVVVESGPGLMLVSKIRALNPHARLVYSVSDRLATVGAHPLVLEAERKALSCFALVRVPAEVMVADFRGFPVKYIPHGLDKAVLEKSYPSPFSSPGNVVSVGDMLFDQNVVTVLARAYPTYTFHLFGRRARLSTRMPNVIEHGEAPFATIVPYIQHADVGLAPYREAAGAVYLAQSSLKIAQYRYCKLPTVAPNFVANDDNRVFGYDPKDPRTAVSAMQRALADPREEAVSTAADWDEVVHHILHA